MRITTLYDNYKSREDLEIGWGFSCLIENNEKILFDTGEEDKKIFSNMEKLNINIKDIDILVISHNHFDHTGGLNKIKELNPNIKILMPESFSEPKEIAKSIYTTGLIQGNPSEQSLILKTEKGLVIITGCAHPGIIEIIKKSKDFLKEEIYLVLGGFHLMGTDDNKILEIIKEFKNLGVKKAAPSHCTGDRAIELFKQEYKENFVENGAGNILII